MSFAKPIEDRAGWIRAVLTDFVARSPENTLQNREKERAFDAPLVGFSRGDDPILGSLKEHVGPFHWTPQEIFVQSFPGAQPAPHELTVISWILPQTEATKEDNRRERVFPSERWARARIYGEEVNVKLRDHLVEVLTQAGFQAMAPSNSSLWSRKMSERYGFASTWSERHAAYASGLGTFGLCDGLITPKGKAMRAGSVVARIEVAPTPRPYEDHRAYCLFSTRGLCGKCMDRCPVGAITEAGHDKLKCLQHLRPGTHQYVKSHFGFDGYGCGLCQTGVPCESKVPGEEDL